MIISVKWCIQTRRLRKDTKPALATTEEDEVH